MAYEQNFDASKHWFIGENKVLEFEVLQDDGKVITDTTKAVEDVTTWTMVFSMKKSDIAADPALVEKRTGASAGITITGVYNASRGLNTQRVVVTILDSDTDALKALTYRYSLKRIAAGADAILAYGNIVLLKATAPAA